MSAPTAGLPCWSLGHRGHVAWRVHLLLPGVFVQTGTVYIRCPSEGSRFRPVCRLIVGTRVDSGYVDAGLLVQSQAQGIDLVGPASAPQDWQTRAGLGFDQEHFTIDWQAHTATCPQGQRSVVWKRHREHHGQPVIRVEFAHRTCLACPVRAQCTRATTGPRTLALRPHAEFDALRAARARQQTDDFKRRYAIRAGIEGTFSQAVRVFDLRQARYIGHAKTHLQHILIAVALNVARLCAWVAGTARAPSIRASCTPPHRAVGVLPPTSSTPTYTRLPRRCCPTGACYSRAAGSTSATTRGVATRSQPTGRRSTPRSPHARYPRGAAAAWGVGRADCLERRVAAGAAGQVRRRWYGRDVKLRQRVQLVYEWR